MRRVGTPKWRMAALGWLCASTLVTTGCPKTGQTAESVAVAPSLEDFNGQAKCGVKRSSAKPLVIEWPAAERAALEARASRGLVAVRYSGCEMEVLTTCTASGNYEYVGLNQKREAVRITNTDQLYAELPIGAAGLESKLERAGQLNVDMNIVGRQEATKSRFNERDLDGRCDEATHVVTGLTVGAFSFYTGKSATIGAGASVGNVGAGVGSTTDQQVLKTDGDIAACGAASNDDLTAPDGCGALLRVEVVPVDRIFEPAGSSATATADAPPADPNLDRKLKTARALTLAGYGGFLVGASMGTAGYVMYTRNKKSLEAETGFGADISPDRETFNSRARLGAGLGWSGIGLAIAGGVLGIYGSKRAAALQRQQRLRATVSPVWNGDMTGVSVGGKF